MTGKTTIETRTVTSVEARKGLMRCFDAKRPVFLWGPPGIGKSELIAGIAEELNGHMIDMRMSLMEPTDLRGIPFYNKDTGMMEWAPPADLPTEEFASQYDHIILFLDEMNAAPPTVQAAGYQLILNRAIGNYKLPDNVVIVAAGNRETDKGVTYRMPTPLANRFVHLELRVDFMAWFDWAVANDVHPDVTGFLTFSKESLFEFDPRSASRAFATPRSWVFVSDLIATELDENVLTDLVAGTVGEGLAIKFQGHRKNAANLPNPEDILSGKVKDLNTNEISAQYSLIVSMCYELKANLKKMQAKDMKGWFKQADNFFEYMMKNFKIEVNVMGARVAITNYGLPMMPGKLKSFDAFHARFGKYINKATSTR